MIATMRVCAFAVLLLFCATLIGCASEPQYYVSVTAWAGPDAESAKRYVLIPGGEIRADDLQYLEYAGYLDRALQSQGFEKASGTENAEVIVSVIYSIEEPQRHAYTYSVPTFFTRTLGLLAMEPPNMQPGMRPSELWRLTAVSSGYSGDLRSVFPYLVAAARPYLGKGTPAEAVDVTLVENDPTVNEVRGNLPEILKPTEP